MYAIAAVPIAAQAQSLTLNGNSYSGYFGPAGSSVAVVVPPIPDGTALSLFTGGTSTGALGTYWDATVTGGLVTGTNPGPIGPINLPETRVEALPQVALNGSNLQFNITNSPSLLNVLALGANLGMSWSATSTFDVGSNQLVLQPNSTYQVSFDVNNGSGLLFSGVGVLPTLGVQLLDGAGSAIGSAGSGTLVNVLNLSTIATGTPGVGRATVSFQTGSTVGAGAASLRFTGSSTLNVSATPLSNTNFATFNNVNIQQVPEASSLAFAVLGGALMARRRRA